MNKKKDNHINMSIGMIQYTPYIKILCPKCKETFIYNGHATQQDYEESPYKLKCPYCNEHVLNIYKEKQT